MPPESTTPQKASEHPDALYEYTADYQVSLAEMNEYALNGWRVKQVGDYYHDSFSHDYRFTFVLYERPLQAKP